MVEKEFDDNTGSLQELMEMLPAVNEATFSGPGRSVIEVIGMASGEYIDMDTISSAVLARETVPEMSERAVPALTDAEALSARELLGQLERVDWRGDASKRLLVEIIDEGSGGKLVYFVTTSRRGKTVIGNLKKFVKHDRLVAERKYAFMKQLDSETVSSNASVLTIPVDLDDIDSWGMMSATVAEAFLEEKISESEHKQTQDMLVQLRKICGEGKAYIKGVERTVDLKDFLTVVERTGQCYLDIVFEHKGERTAPRISYIE